MSFPSLCAGVAAALLIFACPSLAQAGAGYFAPAQELASGVIVADSGGALHPAHTDYDGPYKGRVYYRACEADCFKPEAWQTLEFPFEDRSTSRSP